LKQYKNCALILGAHGSLAAVDSNQPLHDLAAAIAMKDIFATVMPAFLNGLPEMNDFVRLLPEGVENIIIVPAMTSVGYYLQKVIPKRLAENPEHNQYKLFITPVIGMHDKIAGLILARVDRMLKDRRLDTGDTTVALIGHGTRRNANSSKSTYALLQQLKDLRPELNYEIAFLDQDPEADAVAKSISTRHKVVVPFLISRGPHTTVDIPEAFGLPSGPDVRFPNAATSADGDVCVCDLPMGMYPQIADLCIEVAIAELENGTPVTLPQLESTT
jgi:sirohydrochlorin cobaltochelatase